jgi:hypothetical protein
MAAIRLRRPADPTKPATFEDADPALTIPSVSDQRRQALAALAVMLVVVGLQVAGTVLMKVLADSSVHRSLLFLAVGIGAVLFLNLLRLVGWGVAHRYFPISMTFPLSSLYFPAMVAVAFAIGEPVRAKEVIGGLMITAGSFWLTAKAEG